VEWWARLDSNQDQTVMSGEENPGDRE
jgi:hypothetical protein